MGRETRPPHLQYTLRLTLGSLLELSWPQMRWSYLVESLHCKHGGVPAMGSKRMKFTLLITCNKGFCLRKTFLAAGGYRSEVNHVPLSYW